MRELVVLAERDILEWLNNIGIKPHRFYTDLEKFKSDMFTFIGYDIVIMFCGGCKFSQTEIVNVYNNFLESLEDKSIAVNSVKILSNTNIESIKDVYYYKDFPLKFTNGKKTDIKVWNEYIMNTGKCLVHLDDNTTLNLTSLNKYFKEKDYSEEQSIRNGIIKPII